MEGSFTVDEKYKILQKVAILGVFLGFAFFVYRNFRISGLYMDDLYMWSCYGEQSFLEYVFPLGSTRFRPVYWFVAWIQLGIIGNHITWIVPMNILIATGTAYFIYNFAFNLSDSRLVSFFLGIMFLASRFAYYNIGQLLGLMEAMCIIFVLVIAWFLYQYIKKGKKSDFYKALFFYILICFTHERFMVLLPLFYFVKIVRKSKNIMGYLIPLLIFIFIQIVRAITIGTVLPAGTGGTNVADTFTIQSFFSSLWSEILYLFGVNAGPEHLSGMPWELTPSLIRIFIYLGLIIAILMVCAYIVSLIFIRKSTKLFFQSIFISLFFILMIGANLVSSAVTTRVEMRWIYASYTVMLLLIAHFHRIMIKAMKIRLHEITPDKEMRILLWLPVTILFIWGGCLLPLEYTTYTKMDRIYLFPNQKRYNSLADETYGKYGEDIFYKEIYIVGNSYKMADFTKNTFFKVYNTGKIDRMIPVNHIESIKEIGLIEEHMIVLKEDPVHDVFVDATDIYRNLKCEIIKGYYRDGWMDEEAEINVMSGATGVVELEFMYPEALDGTQLMSIAIDDNIPEQIEITENVFYLNYKTKPFAIMNLKFANDFYLANAQEQRGDKKLSIIMNVSVK